MWYDRMCELSPVTFSSGLRLASAAGPVRGSAAVVMSRQRIVQPTTSTCNIKMPDGILSKEDTMSESLPEPDVNFRKRQQLITFAHTQWGFKHWSWSVTKQELDFVDFSNGKYSAGVATFVSVTITSLGIHREDVGYATTVSFQKGQAIYNARKASITNALRETLSSFGGSIASQLMELLESNKIDKRNNSEGAFDNGNLNHQPLGNFIGEPKNALINGSVSHQGRNDSSDSSMSAENNNVNGLRSPQRYGNLPQTSKVSGDKSRSQSSTNHNARIVPPLNPIEMQNFPANQVAPKSGGFVANHNPKVVNPINPTILPPSAIVPGTMRPTPGPQPLPSSQHQPNLSYLVQHVMPPLYSVQCGTPHTPPPPMYHNTFYTEFPTWPLYDNFERHQNKVDVNMQPKNLTINGQTGIMECRQTCGVRSPSTIDPEEPSIATGNYIPHPFNMNGAWIKPTIFYDGFWTEQKVKSWVTEQMDKLPVIEEASGGGRVQNNTDTQKQMCHSKV